MVKTPDVTAGALLCGREVSEAEAAAAEVRPPKMLLTNRAAEIFWLELFRLRLGGLVSTVKLAG